MRNTISTSFVAFMILISSQNWQFSTSVQFDWLEANMRDAFQELLAARNFKEPYQKFYKTYAKLTVCSLRKSQKSELCGELTKHSDTSWLALDTDNYEDHQCSRIEFQWPVPPTEDVSLGEISAAPCPPFVTAEDRPYDAQGPNTLLYFVASSMELKKVLFFERNDLGEPILSGGMAYDIDLPRVLGDEKSNSADEEAERDAFNGLADGENEK